MSGTFTMALEGIFHGVKSAGKGMGEFMTNCMKFGKW